jgi:hypothetical protein
VIITKQDFSMNSFNTNQPNLWKLKLIVMHIPNDRRISEQWATDVAEPAIEIELI